MITGRRLILSLTTLAAIVSFWLVATRGSSDPHSGLPESRVTVPKNTTGAPSTNRTDLALAREIDRAIDESDAAQARWGVFVVSLNDSRVLYSRNGDKPFTPASNMKIYTTAVALELLGSDYRWRTSVYAPNPVDSSGVVEGDLILYGRGAPDLDSKRKDSLASLADRLYQNGVRHVRGNIVGDESYFRGELYGLGWQWNDLQWYFGAEPSALSIDENSIEVTIAPANKSGTAATVVVTPNDDYVHLTNSTTTGDRNAPTSIGINRELSSNDLRVWGQFPTGGRSFSAFLSIHNPALRAATLFQQSLSAHGIQVDGEARSRDARIAENEKFDPQKATELAHIESTTLSEIVRKTNKESNNLYAELILRTLGKERASLAPDPDARKNRERGDDQAGTAVVKWWLSQNGIPVKTLGIHDGSGLSRLDLVTPESAALLLAVIAKSDSAYVFRNSLPFAGRDGTLRGRLLREAGRIVAKTGSLTYHYSLSGYATTSDEEVLAFSIFCNDAAGPGHPIRTIDTIAALLTTLNRRNSSELGQK
jgi:D-alanyl-D-alanine carboxypeptidase/D-alanyl-D-alanine-endopeptidase (penicillin-binding protein 4)